MRNDRLQVVGRFGWRDLPTSRGDRLASDYKAIHWLAMRQPMSATLSSCEGGRRGGPEGGSGSGRDKGKKEKRCHWSALGSTRPQDEPT